MEERPHQADLVVARLPISAVVLDAAGVILDVSAGWKAFADEGGLRLPNHAVGANYLKYCVFTDKSSVELLSGLQQVLGHQIDCFGTAYPCHTSVRQRWFMMAAFPIVGSAGRAAVLHINITSLIQDVSDPSVIMLGRGPAAVDHAQNVMTKLIKRSVAETLSAFHFPVREPVHEATPADGRKIARLADRE